MKMVQLGPGMYSQSSGPCDECHGKGEIINEKDKCKTCNGKKVVKEKKIIDVDSKLIKINSFVIIILTSDFM